MENLNNKIKNIDPDYQENNTALRKVEEKDKEENSLNIEKISQILAKEFDRELANRQKQLEEVENGIFKAQKLLHIVRYVITKSYYEKQNSEISEESVSLATNFDKQSRIHPALKKLLGSNSNVDILKSGKRRTQTKQECGSERSGPYLSLQPPNKKIKFENKSSVVESVESKVETSNSSALKNRQKTKHRIVVGNISKWMPSSENDNTTHKWMVYVRGEENKPDVSHIIEKVVFYLHPSYKPHDVVEISTSPFHLSRRGWGEFPMRVQIHFKCSYNKPVSIVHNIKLDKTYTGRQTLGNETLVDIYLHDEIPKLTNKEITEECNIKAEHIETNDRLIKNENLTNINNLKQEIQDEDINVSFVTDENNLDFEFFSNGIDDDPTQILTSFEHNYCHEEKLKKEIKIENNCDVKDELFDCRLTDHSYSLPFDEDNLKIEQDEDIVVFEENNIHEYQNLMEDNKLMFGLDESYSNLGTTSKITISSENGERVSLVNNKSILKTLTTTSGQPITFLPHSFNKILLNNGNVQIKLLKVPKSNTNTIKVIPIKEDQTEIKIDYEKYKITLPQDYFKNIGEALPYLFKRLGLWDDKAKDIDFKCTYPFVATSKDEFLSWNIGRKLNSEWCRAKEIKKILSNQHFPGWERWNTKAIFMYSRSHGYSCSVSCGNLFGSKSMELQLLATCFLQSRPNKKFNLRDKILDDGAIDVESSSQQVSNLKQEFPLIDITDKSLGHRFAFVKEAALDCGIVLKKEEIIEGVKLNASERVMYEAMKCFAESLIRRSRHYLMCQDNYQEGRSEVTDKEIEIALKERSEINSIFNFKKKKQEMDFFS